MNRSFCLLLPLLLHPSIGVSVENPVDGDAIQCAVLEYGGGKTSRCFSDGFLRVLERESEIRTEPGFRPVSLGSEEVFGYPFSVMTGDGSFQLSAQERRFLRLYLEEGGFLLASASCSDAEWNRSFRAEMEQVFPGVPLTRLTTEHPLFHTIFDINRIQARGITQNYLEGLEIDGRVVLVYSHLGLNETGEVKGCCCCGGNEIVNASRINANILAYALTH